MTDRRCPAHQRQARLSELRQRREANTSKPATRQDFKNGTTKKCKRCKNTGRIMVHVTCPKCDGVGSLSAA